MSLIVDLYFTDLYFNYSTLHFSFWTRTVNCSYKTGGNTAVWLQIIW